MPVDYVSTTSRDICNEGKDIKVSFSFTTPVFVSDTLYQGSSWCFLDDFGVTHKSGTPSLPIRIDNICLPVGADSAVVEVVKVEYADYPCEITPSHPTPLNGDFSIYTKENVPPITGSTFGNNSDYIKNVNYETTQGRRHVNVSVIPCQYDANSKVVRVARRLEYVIKPIFKGNVNSDNSQRRFVSQDSSKRMLKSPPLTVNYNDYPYREGDPLYIPEENTDYDDLWISYLIITHERYLDAAKKFALSKKRLGMTTYVSSRSSWTEAQVKDTIQAYYNANEIPKLRYVLLMGDVNDIPAKMIKSTISYRFNYFPSDYYYACLNGVNDTTQDVYIGRFSVNTLEEAYDIVDKTIEYINNPLENDDVYQRGIHVAYFGDSMADYDGFILNSETARQIAVDNGIAVQRLYYAAPKANPTSYNDSSIPFPDYLKKPNFKWDNDKYKIADSINAGASYVLYRGHGLMSEWKDPNFKTTDFSLLQNNFYPVFFSTTCLSGKYDYEEDCFAEKLLKLHKSGAVGVIACSQESYPTYNNLASCNILQNIYVESKKYNYLYYDKISDVSSATLGRIPWEMYHKAASVNIETAVEHRDSYNLFGDPSLVMWTDFPSNYTDAEVRQINVGYQVSPGVTELVRKSIQINLDEEGCFVAAYDKVADKSYLMIGPKLSFPYFDPERFDMTIYGINRRPKNLYVEEPETGFIFLPGTNAPIISVSPNPVSSTCTITYDLKLIRNPVVLSSTNELVSSNTNGAKIMVVSLQTGGVVRTYRTNKDKGSFSVDFSSLPSGQYVIYLAHNNSNSTYVANTRMIVQ